MKKSFNINVNGIIFYIDEDAYEKLKAYLERLKQHFSQLEGGTEIVNDIEARIAELLRERLNEQKQVVSIEDIQENIKILGEPSEMEEDEEQEEKPPRFDFEQPKRLYRDPDNKIIGGVGGGMGAYFNTDPLWFRLLFVLSFFVVGPLAYIIFWIAIPKARTTAEKLEMKGKKVNIDNIEQSVKNEFKDIGENFEKYTSKAKDSFNRNKQGYRNTSDRVLDGLYEMLVFAVKLIGIVFGIIFIITGLSLVASFLSFMFIPDIPVFFTNELAIHFSLPIFMDMFFSGGLDTTLIIMGMIIVFGLPVVGLVVLGLRLVFGSRIKTHYFGPTALIIWFVALLVTGLSITFTINDFRYDQSVKDKIALNNPDNLQTLHFKIDESMGFVDYHEFNKYIFYKKNGKNQLYREDFRGRPNIGFYPSKDSTSYVVLRSKSRGENPVIAENRAQKISYGFRQQENEVILDPWFYLPEGEKFRAQEVSVKVFLPENTRFKIDDQIDDIAYPWSLDDDEIYIFNNEEIEAISD